MEEEEEETFSVHSVILSILLREGDRDTAGLGGSGPNLNGELAGETFCRGEREREIVILTMLLL